MLKRRMAATQQASELQVGNEVYEKLFEPVPASSPMIRDLPVDKLRPFFTADIGFHPYPKDKLVAFPSNLPRKDCLSASLSAVLPAAIRMRYLPVITVQRRGD